MERYQGDLISIIIPVYNAEKYINRCIDSILMQDFSNYEVILVNDGSSKECSDILRQLSTRYKFIKLIEQSNQGVSSARNNGIKNCSGDWIVFIDADDYIEKSFLSSMVSTAKQYVADIVISEYFTCVGKTTKYSKFLNEESIREFKDEERIDLIKSCIESRIYGNKEGATNIGVPWAKMYKRSIFNEVAFINELPIMEDAIFNINVFIRANKIVYVPVPLYYYVIHMDSAIHSMQRNFESIAQRIVECLLEFEKQFSLKVELSDAIYYKMFCLYYQCIKSQYIKNPDQSSVEIVQNMRRISKKYDWDGKITKEICKYCTKAQIVYGVLARFDCYRLLYILLKISELK